MYRLCSVPFCAHQCVPPLLCSFLHASMCIAFVAFCKYRAQYLYDEYAGMREGPPVKQPSFPTSYQERAFCASNPVQHPRSNVSGALCTVLVSWAPFLSARCLISTYVIHVTTLCLQSFFCMYCSSWAPFLSARCLLNT
jgi:hypothetical protein